MQTYEEVINYLYDHLPYYQRSGQAAYKDSLDNTITLDVMFDHPHQNFKSVHVAGTNGKGSVSHMLASILMESGYKTGLYTSPHLKDFRERIQINGKKIENCNEHFNLTYVCPNCHRLIHEGKIQKSELISLDKILPENWIDLYFG